MTRRVLFVCVHNSGRSQMAEAFARELSGGRLDAESAGTEPTAALNLVVVEAMRERGLDITGQRPKLLTPEMAQRADRIFTMGCYEAGHAPRSCSTPRTGRWTILTGSPSSGSGPSGTTSRHGSAL